MPDAQEDKRVGPDAAAHARMDPELKAKWIAALRSGEYAQIHGQLRKDGGFCCLGVLCDLSPEIVWDGPRAVFGHDQGPDASSDDSEPPHEFAKAINVPDRAVITLVNMNDGHEKKGIRGHSFEQIADWIEANL